MKRHKASILFILLVATVATAGAIKVWSTNETLRSADLNSNFSHIHSLMVGGHGARLVNADVAANAAISISKINVTAIAYPRAWGLLPTSNSNCNVGSYSSTCTPIYGTGVTSIVNSALGQFDVTLNYTPTDVNFAVFVTPSVTGAALGRSCTVTGMATTTPNFRVTCYDLATPTAAVTTFSFLVMDDN